MSSQNLVKMANDIGRFFASEPKRADAVAGIAGHMQRFWEARMLRKVVVFARDATSSLDELPREAILSLKIPESVAPPTPAAPAAPAATGANADGAGH